MHPSLACGFSVCGPCPRPAQGHLRRALRWRAGPVARAVSPVPLTYSPGEEGQECLPLGTASQKLCVSTQGESPEQLGSNKTKCAELAACPVQELGPGGIHGDHPPGSPGANASQPDVPAGTPRQDGAPSWGLRFPSSAHEGRLTGSPQVPPCGAGPALMWQGCRALAHPPAPAPGSRPAAPRSH